MDWTRDGAQRWRRRLRTSWQAIVWGVLCCFSGLLYGMLTTGQPDNVGMDILSVLGIVLLVVGLSVTGFGVLGLAVSLLAVWRHDRFARDVPAAPPRFVRLGVLPWAVAVLFFAGGVGAHLAPAALCAVGTGTTVDVQVDRVVIGGKHHHMAGGNYVTPEGDQWVVIQDAAPPVGSTVRACVGWAGYSRAWTRFPWSGLWVIVSVGVPLLVVEGMLVRVVLRGPAHEPRTVKRRHSVV